MRKNILPVTGPKNFGKSKAGLSSLRRLRLVHGFVLSLIALAAQAAPRHVCLTWQGDTSRTITVNYQTFEPAKASTVHYDTEPRQGGPGDYRYTATGSAQTIYGLADGRKLHWVELRNLSPGKTYYFIAGDPEHGFTPERKFRTIPSGSENLRFVIGGDMGTGSDVPVLLKQAARSSPAFGVVGGDIAYANDMLTNYSRWDAWLDHWETNMVTLDGYTIPMVLAIGNHEVRGGTASSPTNAQFYLRYFMQNGNRTYYSRTFGKNLAMFVLDSGHLSRHGGAQAAWLDLQLSAMHRVPTKFAVYHVPLYPCVRAYDGGGSVVGRQTWLPLFDIHHLTAAFEHHDHAFKRTHLLREDKVDPGGTLYLGDGCWGMSARKVDEGLRWYEAKAATIQHFWCVDVSSTGAEYRAVNKAGQVFDVYPPDAAGAKDAEAVYESLTMPKAVAAQKSETPKP